MEILPLGRKMGRKSGRESGGYKHGCKEMTVPAYPPFHSEEAKSSTASEDMGGDAGSQHGGETERQPVSAGERRNWSQYVICLSFI